LEPSSGRRAVFIVFLLAANLLVYGNSFHGSFVFDDHRAIRDNPHIRALWPPAFVLSAPPDASVARRPVVGLSLAANYAIGGLDVRGYHAVNLAIHCGATLLLFALLLRSLRGPMRKNRRPGASDPSALRPHSIAAAAALLWSVHPLLTDAVDYTVQRTELLMSLFLLLTIYGVVRAAESARPNRWLALSVIACTLGMASKEVMVVAPILALLYDRAFLSGSFRAALRARGRAYAALAATWLVVVSLVWLTPSTQRASDLALVLRPIDYFRTQAGVLVHYLRLSVWPAPLSIAYDDWPIARGLAGAALPGVAALALLALTVWLQRKHPRLGFAGAWFFLILAPTSSVLPIPSEIVAERRMYLPLAAVVACAVLSAEAGARALGRRAAAGARGDRSAPPFADRLALAILLAAALALGAATRDRNEVYRDERTIWIDVLAKRPQSATARIHLGYLLEQERRLPEALEQYTAALAYRPESGVARSNIGAVLLAMGRPHDAVVPLREAVRLLPQHAQAHINLGSALISLHLVDEGVRELEEATRLDPFSADAHNNLGFGYTLQGRIDDALTELARADRINPRSAATHFNRGLALNAARREDEAIAEFAEAVRIDPAHVHARVALAEGFAEAGRFDEAARAASLAEKGALAAGQKELAGAIAERRRTYEANRDGRAAPRGEN